MLKSKEELGNIFANPSHEWRGKPFWSWNGELEEKELCRQVEVLKEMGFGGHFMHSRSGLRTEYLGEEWFKLINAVTDKSVEENMEAWLYDEDRWPSGSAGGKVTVDPNLRMHSLRLNEYPVDIFEDKTEFMFKFIGFVTDDKKGLLFYREIGSKDDAEKIIESNSEFSGGEWKILAFDYYTDPDDSNYNGSGYLNTIDKKATEKFIESTHEKYKEKCGDRVGTTIKGIFTDEPHRGHAFDDLKVDNNGVRTCSTAWTKDFFEEFEERYGYNPVPLLPELFYKYKNKKVSKIKINWLDLACNLFNERFAQPINDWCNKNNMQFTGHVLHEDALINQTICNGSLMRFYENMGYPGVDVLSSSNYCYWIVKQLSSTARQTGKQWLLSELYGCTGWDFDFTDHKNIGDWQALFGINLRCPHLSWYTMEGEAKRDYPASILHQAPWYKDYKDIETYFARFAVMGTGKSVCDTLVLNPIESVWGLAYPGWTRWLFSIDKEVDEIEEQYEKMFFALTRSHIDFDYGEEEMMRRLAKVETVNGKPVFKVGNASYKTVVIHGMLTIRSSTMKLLKEFKDLGGKIIFVDKTPEYLDGEKDDEPNEFAKACIQIPFDEKQIAKEIKSNEDIDSYILNEDGTENGDVFIRNVLLDDGTYTITLLNTNKKENIENITVKIKLPNDMKNAEEWDLMSGEKYGSDSFIDEDGYFCIKTSILNGGTKAFVVAKNETCLEKKNEIVKTTETFDLSSTVCKYKSDEKNVCVLDRVIYRIDGGEWQEENEMLRADRKVREHFGIEHRGGSMLQPWYSLIHKQNVLGKVEMKYIFFIDKMPTENLILAGERPENLNYSINGVKLKETGKYWVDICFKEMIVPLELLHEGRNEITITTDFTQNTNFENVYLIGNFGVKLDGPYTRITDLPENITFGNLAKNGFPFYGANITYTIPANAFDEIKNKAQKTGKKVYLNPNEVRGSLVKYKSDVEEGKAHFRPYMIDITKSVLEGCDIELTLVGNRQNTFGPLHRINEPFSKDSGPHLFVTGNNDWSPEFQLAETGIQELFVKI